VINAVKQQFGGKMDAEINNVIYMELYSGPERAHGKYEKTNVAGTIDRDSTVVPLSKCLEPEYIAGRRWHNIAERSTWLHNTVTVQN
jgi:hypothetical protein